MQDKYFKQKIEGLGANSVRILLELFPFVVLNGFLYRVLCLWYGSPINSYHSFWWNNVIFCLYNVNTLNICMKQFSLEKIYFDKMTAVRT